MATGGADLHKAVRETLLVCQVCREDFALDSRPPRLLPCFHCFCQPCLSRLGETPPLRCPQCRGSFSAEDVWLLDTTRTQLLELTDLKEGGHERSCEGCSQSLPAQSWCQHCAQALCQQCCQAHRQLKILNDHTLLPLSEVTEEQVRQLQVTEKCAEHPMERLKFFCENCDAAACSDCAILFHSGHRLTGLQAVVEERRKQVLSWCHKVETALPAFQDREASSHARFQRLDSALQDKVQRVETLFSDIVSKVMARQDEVLVELRSKFKGQRLEMEEQHCKDQSAVESARNMVDHGKRVASLGLPTQLIGLPKRMEEVFTAPHESDDTVIGILPDLMIIHGKLPLLMETLEKVGTVVVLPFNIPEFKFAPAHNPEATVDIDGGCFTNDIGPEGDGYSTRGNLNGTIITDAAPDTSCYWQVRCLVTPCDDLRDGLICEMGIWNPESSQNEYWYVSPSNQGASVVTLKKEGDRIIIAPFIEGTELPVVDLSVWSSHIPLDCTIGFLLDRPGGKIHIIDVRQVQALVSEEITTDKPLSPVLCVCPKDELGADVRLELQSGEKMRMSSDTAMLLMSLLSG